MPCVWRQNTVVAVAVATALATIDAYGQNADPGKAGPPPHTAEAQHAYSDGTHIIIGEIGLPTPCHVLDWQAAVETGDPDVITIHLASTDMTRIAPGLVCPQVITSEAFGVAVQADEDAAILATLNATEIDLHLEPVDALDPGDIPNRSLHGAALLAISGDRDGDQTGQDPGVRLGGVGGADVRVSGGWPLWTGLAALILAVLGLARWANRPGGSSHRGPSGAQRS